MKEKMEKNTNKTKQTNASLKNAPKRVERGPSPGLKKGEAQAAQPKQQKSVRAEKPDKAGKVRPKEKKVDLKSKEKSRLLNRITIFGVINLICLILIFVIIGELPEKALELKNLINSQVKAEESKRVNISDLEIQSNREKADKIQNLFPDDSGLIDFIKLIENRKEQGSVVNFSFASQEPVRDGTANLGIPVVIEFRGTWQEIDRDLQEIQSSAYLFRPITIEAKPRIEENVIEFMYGGFLYVDESLEQI